MYSDKSLEELEAYQGSSPCPKDFDEFWDAQIQSLQAVDLQLVERKDTHFSGLSLYDLWFSSWDSARVYAKYVRPKKVDKPLPLVYSFHGYTANSGDWSSLAFWAKSGAHALSIDCRGQGGFSHEYGTDSNLTVYGQIVSGLDSLNPEHLMFVKIFKDVYLLLISILNHSNLYGEDEIDKNKIMSIGGSQGGALSLVIAALFPEISSIVSAYPFLSDYKRVYEMGLHSSHAYKELGRLFRAIHPQEYAREYIWETLGYIDIQNLAKRIRGNVVMLTGLMDEVCPPSTQFAIYNKIRSNKQILVLPEYAHEYLPFEKDICNEVFWHMIHSTRFNLKEWYRGIVRPIGL